jgi:hypothetical protein
MYCPRCGNHPAPGRVRFCPSCGLRLDGFFDLLAREGNPPHPAAITQANEPSPRKHGIRQGAKLCFFSIVSFLPIFGICLLMRSPGPLFLPATTFLAGIFWMLYFRIFADEYEPPVKYTTQQQIYVPPLPQQAVPAYRSPIEQPPQQSVIENTTRLLESE